MSLKELKDLLFYDPKTGVFTWKDRGARKFGGFTRSNQIAGSRQTTWGYWQIGIGDENFLAHRLAWFYVFGEWPNQIDHINRDRCDNRIANLRLSNPTLNQHNRDVSRNNTSGTTGVSFITKAKRWQATIGIDGKNANLGLFTTKDLAIAARKTAEVIWFPGVGNTGGVR